MILETIPSYLYVQYRDEPVFRADTQKYYAIPQEGVASIAITGLGPPGTPVSDLQAFVNSYNVITQQYLNSVNTLNLPIYTKQIGYMLDWVASGLYGVIRPTLPVAVEFSPDGVYNTKEYNSIAYNQDVENVSNTFYPVTDDYFKRILTWNFYKGDGFQYTTSWLKRRIKRFLDGIDGVSPDIQETYDISVSYTAPVTITITIADTYPAQILQSAIAAGAVYLPFQYSYVVDLV